MHVWGLFGSNFLKVFWGHKNAEEMHVLGPFESHLTKVLWGHKRVQKKCMFWAPLEAIS